MAPAANRSARRASGPHEHASATIFHGTEAAGVFGPHACRDDVCGGVGPVFLLRLIVQSARPDEVDMDSAIQISAAEAQEE
jgi:hypothetical protein